MTMFKMVSVVKFVVVLALFVAPLAGYAAPKTLPELYNEKGLTDEGEVALKILRGAGEHGIEPERYGVKELDNLRSAREGITPEEVQEINQRALKSLALYLMDLRYGIVEAPTRLEKIGSDERGKYRDGLTETMRDLVDDENYEKPLDKFIGKQLGDKAKEYNNLRNMLGYYRMLQEMDIVAKVPPTRKISPGENDGNIPLIRKNIMIFYSLNSETIVPKINEEKVYDKNTVAMVKKFQRLNGLEEDGIISKQTVDKINSYLPDAIGQIKFSMDKLRGENFPEKGRAIVVNIPEYKLYALNDGKAEFEMNVIVGKQGRETPEMENHVESIVLNPEWTPTQRILDKDLLPKIRNDSSYLTKGGYTITWLETNEVISPEEYAEVDWEVVSPSQIKVRQRAGSQNSLGRVKFSLPNSDAIYLHDTNSPGLFKKSFRALSAGCVRVEEPIRLAEFILRDQKISGEEVSEKISTRRFQILPTEQVKVFLTYRTAWMDKDNNINLRNDIYYKNRRFVRENARSKLLDSGALAEILSSDPAADRPGVKVDKLAGSINPGTP